MTRRGKWLALGAMLLTPGLAVGVVRGRLLTARQATDVSAAEAGPEGLQFRLSEGKAPLGGEAVEAVPPGAVTPLSEADANRVLARLKPVSAQTDDVHGFALRESSLPAPRAGETIATTFPPAPKEGTPPTVETGPLTVRRIMPEGDVSLADRVSVTFSQPMVAVSSQEEAAQNVPVTLTPSVPGTWRWLGTQTLIFDAGSGKRLPMATSYQVTIPAGTKSATGGVLAEARTVAFQTPAVRLVGHWPMNNYEPQPRDPMIRLVFDQAIDPDAVVRNVTLSAGEKSFAVRRATVEEIAGAKSARKRAGEGYIGWQPDGTPENRVVVVKPVELLPTGSVISVVVGAGTPSLEGPRTTEGPQTFTFDTYSPLKLDQFIGENQPPESGWMFKFNNPLDTVAFDPASVKIEPAVPGGRTFVNRAFLSITGRMQAHATYTVTLPAGLKDVFGQTLGAPLTQVVHVGAALPMVQGPRQNFIVCDPAAPPRAAFQSINTPSIHVRLYAVTPGDWPAYLNAVNYNRQVRATLPGRLVSDRIVTLKAPADAWGETGVDVTPALANGQGNVVVQWESTVRRSPNELPDQGVFWMQATHLGLMAQNDASDLYAWVTELVSGKAVGGASVELLSAKALERSATSTVVSKWDISTAAKASTKDDGMARLGLNDRAAQVLVARRGEDMAFLPASYWYYENSGWTKVKRPDEQRWFIFDDRRLYRPGETVHMKGWMRLKTPGVTGDLTLPTDLKRVDWELHDSRGNKVQTGTAPVNAWAGFDFKIALPKTMNLGYTSVVVNGIWHPIQVEEFRRPEFEVAAKNEGAGPYVVGDAKGADLSVSAKYYAGGALPGTPVDWHVSASPTTYSPPGHEGFTFGTWVPWWSYRGFGGEFGGGGYNERNLPPQTLSGTTGANGAHYLHLDFDSVRPARPYAISAEAVIQDLNRQTRAATTSLIVHPSERYVGLRGKRLFVEKGKSLSVEALVCDIEGKVDAGRRITFRAVRKVWGLTKNRWQESEVDPQTWSVDSAAKPIATEFTPTDGGQWTVSATVRDDKGRANESELTLWVSGGDGPHSQQRGVSGQVVTLIPDLKEYKAGQTATILVQSPFANAEGLATVIHDGIATQERFAMTGGSYTLHVPIVETFLPMVGVQVELVGSVARTDDDGAPIPDAAPRPAFASGQIALSVPATTRQLTVTAVPASAMLSPGAKTTVAVSVRDSSGRPVPHAEAAVVVVDESVLALAGWNLGDPLGTFYPGVGNYIATSHLRQFVLLDDPARLTELRNLPTPPANSLADAAPAGFMDRDEAGSFGGGGFGGGVDSSGNRVTTLSVMSRSASAMHGGARFQGNAALGLDLAKSKADAGGDTPIALRQNFDALAAFAPSVVTDADGKATVPVTLPDNLTRYRIVVVAVAGAKQIGHGEAALTARLPLMARPSAPRFLNFGDKFELPVVLQNQTDAPMTVDVAVRGTNLAFPKAHGWRVNVRANNRVEVRFPAEAVQAGTARFQIAASSGDRADAAEGELPVWTPATTEAFATYGVVDNGAVVQPVKAPGGVVTQFGGLEVTTSSTALQELTDAMIYLQQYPYGCSEQIASRVLATAALKDVLTAFKASGLPKPDAMREAMGRDMARLAETQGGDGGFGFWGGNDDEEYAYLGVHVAHALVTARLKGFDVPKTLYDRSMDYLKHIDTKFDNRYTPEMRRMIRAYALYVRHLAGDTVVVEAHHLLEEDSLEHLGPETVGFLMNVLAGDPVLSSARTWFENHATETAGAAHFAFSYHDGSYLVLGSNYRADAIVLDALIADQPKSDLIPKLVRGLLDGRKRGHWASTQEDAFVLLALDRYFHAYEGTTPDFVARLWLGNKVAGEGKFHGRTTDRIETNVPMAYLARTSGVQNLTLDKQGAGRMYYRIGMRYAPKDLNLKAADYGFTVKRTYEAIDKPSDVRHESDGSWVIRAGAKVRVRLSMIATTRRYHVALTDPLPAGFESLNSELQGTESVARDLGNNGGRGGRWYRWWWGHWWQHENLRDERAEAFTDLLWEGAYEYVYICRATTPGQFVVPPAKAEEMYSPETFGRSGTDRVRVE